MLQGRALQEPWRLVMLRRSTPQERIAKASRTLHFPLVNKWREGIPQTSNGIQNVSKKLKMHAWHLDTCMTCMLFSIDLFISPPDLNFDLESNFTSHDSHLLFYLLHFQVSIWQEFSHRYSEKKVYFLHQWICKFLSFEAIEVDKKRGHFRLPRSIFKPLKLGYVLSPESRIPVPFLTYLGYIYFRKSN